MNAVTALSTEDNQPASALLQLIDYEKSQPVSESLNGKEIIILDNNTKVWAGAKSLSLEESRKRHLSYEVL